MQDICKPSSFLCKSEVPRLISSNQSNRTERCSVIYPVTAMSKISANLVPQMNTCIISLLNSLKVVRAVQSLSTLPDSV